MIKFDGKAYNLVPLVCTCRSCLLGLFQACLYKRFEKTLLRKNVVAASTNLMPETETDNETHGIGMDYPNESYNIANVTDSYSDISMNSSIEPLVDLLDEPSLNDTIIVSEEQPAWIDYESNSENELTMHPSLKVDLDEATARKIFAKKTYDGFKQFNPKKEYFTDFVNDMFKLLDKVSPKMEMRFVALFKFARLIAQFADGKPISDCLGYI